MARQRRVHFRSEMPSTKIVLNPTTYTIERAGTASKVVIQTGKKIQFQNYTYSTTDKWEIEVLRAMLAETDLRGRTVGVRKHRFNEVTSPREDLAKVQKELTKKLAEIAEEEGKELKDIEKGYFCDVEGCEYQPKSNLSDKEKAMALRMHKLRAHK